MSLAWLDIEKFDPTKYISDDKMKILTYTPEPDPNDGYKIMTPVDAKNSSTVTQWSFLAPPDEYR